MGKDVITNLEGVHGKKTKEELIVNGSGSFNDVSVYKVTFNNNIVKKIAVRVAKKPSYQKVISGRAQTFIQAENKYSAKLSPGKTYELQGIKDDEKLSKYNWDLAAAVNLSPELYLYSYIEKELNGKIYLYICSISEGFEFDLDTFFTRIYPSLDKEDRKFYNQTIRVQLTNLFENMAINHGMLCNDIKPKNAVINSDIHAVDVRLIDFDSDYCKIKEKDRHKRGLYALMMQIVFANFIISDYKVNIFTGYFDSIQSKMLAEFNEMMAIFSDTRNNDFLFTGSWYFKRDFAIDESRPGKLFEDLFWRCFQGKIDSPMKSALGHGVVNITNSQQAPSVNSPPGEEATGFFGIAKSVFNFTKSFFVRNPKIIPSVVSSRKSSSHSHSQQLQAAETGVARVANKKKKKIGEPCTDNKQ